MFVQQGLFALLLTLSTTAYATCAADYSACGSSLPSPIGNLPCCNSSFYCYTHGPYFSQCRPIHEDIAPFRAFRKPLCGRSYGVCSAGSSADTRLQCCDSEFVCVPASPLFWQCVPRRSRWYEVQVSGMKKVSYMEAEMAVRVGARVLADGEKVVVRVKGGKMLEVRVPRMSRMEWKAFLRGVGEVVGVRKVDGGVGVVRVVVDGDDPEIVARRIASMRQVARVDVV